MGGQCPRSVGNPKLQAIKTKNKKKKEAEDSDDAILLLKRVTLQRGVWETLNKSQQYAVRIRGTNTPPNKAVFFALRTKDVVALRVIIPGNVVVTTLCKMRVK